MDQGVKIVFDKARQYVYQNARPLDLMRWKYHFEHGSAAQVLEALAAYQNLDGGFGHALEADSFNPNSSPIQTWCATEVLYEIGHQDAQHPIVQGILRYLNSGQDFVNGYWLASIPTNNDYPHAPWWNYSDAETINQNWKYNPTISLTGFALCYAEEGSKLYQKAVQIAKRAVEDLIREGRVHNDGHEVRCYLRFCDYVILAEKRYGKELARELKIEEVRELCYEMARENVCRDTKKWAGTYVDRPSRYIQSETDVLYEEMKSLVEYECTFIIEQQQEGGSYEITWNWPEYPQAWGMAKTWWKTEQTLLNLLYLKHMGCFEEELTVEKVDLHPISRENWYECICLEVDPSQRNYVEKNAFSLVQAAYEPDYYPMGIFIKGHMAGFCMYHYDSDQKIWELCRFMIDRKYQKQGYGKAAMQKLFQYLRELYGPITFYVSFMPENEAAAQLYAQAGFQETDEMSYGESVRMIQL